jgi:cation:H+ antiporter
LLIPIGLIVLGLALLVYGGDVLLRGAVGMAVLLSLTPAVIGLTVVAAGTSIPELAVSGIAAAQGRPTIAAANVIGSNIFNASVIIGLAALVRPMRIEGNTIKLEYPVLALVSLMCLVIMQDQQINWLDAIFCLAVYIGFTAYMVSLVRLQVTESESQEISEEVQELTAREGSPKAWRSILLVLAGCALLGLGAQATITGAVRLAEQFGWSDRTIGLTIVSAGTGLPEVFASLVASFRGRSDVAVGNVIGSNLFNILVIFGVSGSIATLPIEPMLIARDGWWMLAITLLLFPLMHTGLRINRLEGSLMLAVYGAYLYTVLNQAGG